ACTLFLAVTISASLPPLLVSLPRLLSILLLSRSISLTPSPFLPPSTVHSTHSHQILSQPRTTSLPSLMTILGPSSSPSNPLLSSTRSNLSYTILFLSPDPVSTP